MRTKTLEKLMQRTQRDTPDDADSVVGKLTQSQAKKIATDIGLEDEPVSLGMGVYAVACTISPEQAMCWLEDRNPVNRNEISGNIDAIARDIEAGRWALTHQGIAFDKDGNLTDGQNRLAAVVQTDMSVPMIVMIYDGRPVVGVVDRGQSRDFSGFYKMSTGKEVSGMYVGILKAMNARTTSNVRLTNGEMTALMDAHGEAVDWVLEHFPGKIKYITIAPVLAAVALAYYHVEQEKLTRFCNVLRTSMANEDEPAEAVIIALRSYLTAGKANTAVSRCDVLLKTQWAISRYMAGKCNTKVVAATKLIYDVPRNKELKAA